MSGIKTTADYKEALYEKQHMECVTLRASLAEAVGLLRRSATLGTQSHDCHPLDTRNAIRAFLARIDKAGAR